MRDTTTPARRAWHLLAALLCWTALVLQFDLVVRVGEANGLGTGGAVARFFDYFTILTNIGAALSFTARGASPSSQLGRWFSDPVVATGLMLALVLVGIMYSAVLRQLWQPTGVQKAVDMLLHDVTPILLFLDWFFTVPKGRLAWADLPRWCVYPSMYLAYVMGRGRITEWYPYPFIDLSRLTPLQVLLNAVVVLGAVLLLGAMAVWLDGRAGRRRMDA